MRCAGCDTELIAGKKFCHVCGEKAPGECPNCGAAVAPDFRFCPDCGTSLTADGTTAPITRTPPVDERLRHLPEALAQKLRSASDATGERKRVTVLFCDLAGSTAIAENLDPEVFRDLLDRYLALTFQEISRFEGLVNQLAGDGLMALFGAPIAHEDEPERAVRAALAIQDALVGLSATLEDELGFPLEARIGVHTGMVVAGTVGNDLKMDYTAIGDTTNLASRLQGLARPGTVLISDATAQLVQGRFDLRRLPPFEVRGKTGRIVAHEVGGGADAVTPMEIAEARGLTPFVGRSAELDQLDACFDRLDRGLFQIVEVVGAAGSGKSRLLYEFRRHLMDEGPILFEGRCSALGRSTPYGVWEGMLRTFVGAAASDEDAEIVRKVDTLLVQPGYTTEAEAPYLCRFLGVNTEAIAAEPGEITAKNIGNAYQSMMIRAAAQGRLVMILEDVQWIDDASRAGLDEILSSIEALGAMFVVTHRPDYEHDWQINGAVTRLRLRPLPPDESRDIVRAVAGGELPGALEERIVQRAEGNPFFLEEVTRKLVDEGAIERAGGRALLTRDVDDIEIPATVQEVMTARLDHLRPNAKRVAQVAAVLGRQFRTGALASLLASEEIDVGAELTELERAGILHRKNTGGADEYRFGESFTQEVAYDSLLLRERRRLHDRVAELLRRDEDQPLATREAQVGRHFARGNDPERGIEALIGAGERAESIPSYGDAIRLYAEAWEIAEAALQEPGARSRELRHWALRAALRLSHTTVMYGTANATMVDRAASRGIELARELDDTDALARLFSSHGMFVMNRGQERFGEGLDFIREGYAVARAAGNEHAAATLMRSLSFGYLLDGRFDDAERQITETLAELERLQRGERFSDTYMGARFFRQRVLYESDRFDAAEAFARETLTLALQAKNRTIESGTTAGLASLCFVVGRYEEAIDWANRAIPLAVEIDNIGAARSGAAIRALARVSLGKAANRPGETELMQRGLLTSGDLAINMDMIISALIVCGEVERARKLADLATTRAGGRLRAARLHLAKGEALVAGHDGDPCGAYSSYTDALALANEIGARSVAARARLGLGHLALCRGEDAIARENLEAALAGCEALGLVHYARQARVLLDALEPTPPPESQPELAG